MYFQKTLHIYFQRVKFKQGKFFTSARFIRLFRAAFFSATNLNKNTWQTSRTMNNHRNMSCSRSTHTLLNAHFRVWYLFSYFWIEMLEVWRVTANKPSVPLFKTEKEWYIIFRSLQQMGYLWDLSLAPLIIPSTIWIWEVTLAIPQKVLLVLWLKMFKKHLNPKCVNTEWSACWARLSAGPGCKRWSLECNRKNKDVCFLFLSGTF